MRKISIMSVCILLALLIGGCTFLDKAKEQPSNVALVKGTFKNLEFQIENNWGFNYINPELMRCGYNDYIIDIDYTDLLEDVNNKEKEIDQLLNLEFPENIRTSQTEQESIQIDGVQAVLTSFHAPLMYEDQNLGDMQVKIVYFTDDEKFYGIQFINEDFSVPENEQKFDRFIKSIRINKSLTVNEGPSLMSQTFHNLKFSVYDNWNSRLEKRENLSYRYNNYFMAVSVKNNSLKGDESEKDLIFTDAINEFFKPSKVEGLAVISDADSKVMIDGVTGKARTYKGTLNVNGATKDDNHDMIFSIVMFKTGTQLYSLMMYRWADDLENYESEFNQFMESIRIVK